MIRVLATTMLGVALSAGCDGAPADEGPARFPLARDWHYAADQQTPERLHVDGDVVFTFQSGLRFDGAVDVIETDATGLGERRTGILSGRFRDSLNVDFDIRLDVEVRRHVGRITGDSIVGNWAQSSGPTTTVGTFRMMRSS